MGHVDYIQAGIREVAFIRSRLNRSNKPIRNKCRARKKNGSVSKGATKPENLSSHFGIHLKNPAGQMAQGIRALTALPEE